MKLHQHSPFIFSRGNAARVARRGSVVRIPCLLNRLTERVGDLSNKAVGIIVAVGVIVPINDKRVTANGVGVGVGDVEIIRVDKCRGANRRQVGSRRGQLIGDAAITVIGIKQFAAIRLVFLDNQVRRIKRAAICHRLRGVLINVRTGGGVGQRNGYQISVLVVIIRQTTAIPAVSVNDVAVDVIIKTQVISIAALNPRYFSETWLCGVRSEGERVVIAATVRPLLQVGSGLIQDTIVKGHRLECADAAVSGVKRVISRAGQHNAISQTIDQAARASGGVII